MPETTPTIEPGRGVCKPDGLGSSGVSVSILVFVPVEIILDASDRDEMLALEVSFMYIAVPGLAPFPLGL